MSKTQEAPPDSWDMDSNDTNQAKAGDTPSVSLINSGLNAVSLNANAPLFVPNVNAPAFFPTFSAPPPIAQTSTVPEGLSAVVNTATSIQNGKKLGTQIWVSRNLAFLLTERAFRHRKVNITKIIIMYYIFKRGGGSRKIHDGKIPLFPNLHLILICRCLTN